MPLKKQSSSTFAGYRTEQGNALFLILIAVVLFGALSYAITTSGRSSSQGITKEKAMLDAGLAEQCTAYVERGVTLLQIVGKCPADQISYELPSGLNPNPLAPTDKSCHVFDPAGAGLTACGLYLQPAACNLTALAVGEKCANADIVHAGVSSGNRIYATLNDSTSAPYSGSGVGSVTSATSVTNGLANTNTLVALADAGAPYTAALTCRALGADWYLPSQTELSLLYSVRNTGAFNGTFNAVGTYWASNETAATTGRKIAFNSGNVTGALKADTWRIRCVRHD